MVSEKLASILGAFGFAFAAARVWLVINPLSNELAFNCFKDAAHIYMGAIGLIAWCQRGEMRFMFWMLCVIEVACAVISRF